MIHAHVFSSSAHSRKGGKFINHVRTPGCTTTRRSHAWTCQQNRTRNTTYPGQDLSLHSGGRRDRLEDLPRLARAGGHRGGVRDSLPHERLARVEGGHEGASPCHEAERCEGCTELHGCWRLCADFSLALDCALGLRGPAYERTLTEEIYDTIFYGTMI